MTTSTSLLDLVRAAALSLGRLRTSPGKRETWVDGVLRALERERPESYDRLRRRIGFGNRLAELARLDDQEQAIMALGLFFDEIIRGAPAGDGGRPPRLWMEYLVRNEEWLEPCFRVCEFLRSPGWEDVSERAAVVGKVAAVFDEETLERHERPLLVVESLSSDPPTAALEELVKILWSEEGQALSDHHFRRHPKGYDAPLDTIKLGLELLRPVIASYRAPEIVLAPMRLSETHTPARQQKGGRQAGPGGPATSDAFERRRQALRSGSARESARVADDAHSQREATAELEPVAAEPAVPRSREDRPTRPPPATSSDSETDEQGGMVTDQEREEQMDNIRSITAARAERRENVDLAAQLEALRAQLEQIQRIAAQGQELLASVGPQLDEFASWVAHLETMVGRWKRPDTSREQAA